GAAAGAADAALLGDDAGRDPEARARDAAGAALLAGRRDALRRRAHDTAFDRAAAAQRETRLAGAVRSARSDGPGTPVRAHEDRSGSRHPPAAGQTHSAP